MSIHHIKWRCNWPGCNGAIREIKWTKSERIDNEYAYLVLKCDVCGNTSPHSKIVSDRKEMLS